MFVIFQKPISITKVMKDIQARNQVVFFFIIILLFFNICMIKLNFFISGKKYKLMLPTLELQINIGLPNWLHVFLIPMSAHL